MRMADEAVSHGDSAADEKHVKLTHLPTPEESQQPSAEDGEAWWRFPEGLQMHFCKWSWRFGQILYKC